MYRFINQLGIVDAWETVEPWIRRALDEVTQDIDIGAIKSALICGKMLLIIGYDEQKKMDLVLVAEMIDVSGIPTLAIKWAAGHGMKDWLIDLAVFENFAADRGFQQVQIWGRPGWYKMLKPEYTLEFIVMNRKLSRSLN